MKLHPNLFDLTPEQEELSKTIYNGKIIKCLIAPHHTPNTIKMDYAPNIFMFPEKDMNWTQTKQLVALLVASPSITEALIITSSIEIIYDMVDGCCRVLTEMDTIVDCPIKTFAANQHSIRYEILEGTQFKKSEAEKRESHKKINVIIDRVNAAEKTGVTKDEYDSLLTEINLIGEDIISHRLKEMLNNLKLI